VAPRGCYTRADRRLIGHLAGGRRGLRPGCL
ncbi:MAG: hypothetical protein AVDCRST_MAG64-4373, partial [uncultured Phycisphaerae bacterium]